MRTTIRIDDELYRRVKERAVRTGRTVGDVIGDALVRTFAEDDETDERALEPLVTYGGSGVCAGVDLSDSAALRDTMDADEELDALR